MSNDIFFDPNSILEAACISTGTPNQEQIARKIAADGLVRTRALNLAIDSFVVEVLHRMSESERLMLHKRTGVIPPPPQPPHPNERYMLELAARARAPKPEGFVSAKWSVEVLMTRLGEHTYCLMAKCDRCHQQAKCIGERAFFEHCGQVEGVPEQAAKQLRRIQGRMISGDEL